MPALLTLLRDFRALNPVVTDAVSDLFERAFQAVLDAEGPPAQPIPGVSTDTRTAVATSPKGKPLFLCHAWETANWTCLLLDIPPVVMGRPVFIPNPAGKGLPRVVTDYQSQKFQRRIGAACLALNIPPPPEPSRLAAKLDRTRLMVAWAPIPPDGLPTLTGDLDNYAKNVMDALQRARLIKNDRTIANITFSREALPIPESTLDDHLLARLLTVQSEHPDLPQRAIAKLAAVSQRTAKRLLASAKQQPGHPPPAPPITAPVPQILPTRKVRPRRQSPRRPPTVI